MKNDSLNNLRPEPEAATPKKVWVKLEIEMISILSGTRQGGREGDITFRGLRPYNGVS